MTKVDDPFGLIDFAASYLASRSITHHKDVHTDDLADAFRLFFGLPVFAKLGDLHALCDRIGISFDRFEWESDDLEAINGWPEDENPTIWMRSDLTIRRSETGLGHELREIIETSFVKACPGYFALNTHDNKAMNRESDHFASCLLMPAAESRSLMYEIGFDMIRFSGLTGRSLSSVILRAQSLFPDGSGEGPVAGYWLFEAPWKRNVRATGRRDIPLSYRAHLNGFSMAKGRSQAANLARLTFPRTGDCASQHRLVQAALSSGKVMAELLSGFDMFREHDFIAVAEPLYLRNAPPRVLHSAVRTDSIDLVQPWLKRVGAECLAEKSRLRVG